MCLKENGGKLQRKKKGLTYCNCCQNLLNHPQICFSNESAELNRKVYVTFFFRYIFFLIQF